ncbi:hemicentin-1-like [Lycodopsis pacificus]
MEIAVIHFIILVAISGLTKGAGVLPDGPLNAAVGETVMFTTTLTPPETPFQSVSWRFGDRNIIYFNTNNAINITAPEYEGRITLFMSTRSLELRNLTPDDSGEYSVSIVPAGALPVDGKTRLDVHVRVSDVMVTASSTDLVEHSSVRLSCSSSGSSLSFLWFNGSSEVTAGDRVQLTDGGSTLTVNVTRYDQGPYRCQVSNPVSSATSGPIYLIISYGPDDINLTISPSQEYYEEGSDITLTCSADSRPVAHYTWFLNGTLLSDTGPELRLMNIQESESGNYSCQAFNSRTMRTITSQSAAISVLMRVSDVMVTASSTDLVEHSSCECPMSCSEVTAGDRVQLTDGGSTLTVNVTRYDQGPYRCQVSNPVSSATSGPIYLIISYGPDDINLTISPSQEYYEEGSDITLTCSADSRPVAHYTWFLNGTLLSDTGPELRLMNIQEMRVSDVMVTASSTDLVEHSSVRLSCSSSGSSLSFLWFNGSSEVTAGDRVQLTDGGSTLTVNVTRYDQGPYRCQVSNPVSSATSGPIYLIISYGPDDINLTISPSQEYYEEGSDITLTCSADSRPVAHYTWFLNGTLLSDTGPELRLMNIQESESGNYSCQAFNSRTMRTITSQPAAISVLMRVSDVMVTASSTDLVEHSSVRLSCSSSGSSLSFLWFNGSSEVTAGDRVQLTDGGSTLTVNVTRYDQGPYRCQVSNPVSSATSDPIHLFISYGPDDINLTISPSQEYYEEGSDITLTCSADSRPVAHYTWFLNGTLQSDTGPELRLMDIQESESGNYSCQAFNSRTMRTITSQPAAISVLTGVANVTVTSNTTDMLEYSTARLSCSSSASFLSFLWLNGSSEITESDRVQLTDGGSTLTIVSVTRYDQGPFRCQVSNPVSNGTSGPVNLSINYGPENINLTISPSQEHYDEGSDISLMCSAVSRPSALFQWFLNGDRLSDTGPELRLMNIQMSQSGSYSCQAFNNKTLRNEMSQPSVVSVLERISGASITWKTNTLIEGNSFNLSCDAAGSVFTREWKKDGLTLTPDDNMALYDNNRVLSFTSLSKKDTGDYLCKVSNPLSHDEATYTMVVNYGPENVQISGPNEIQLKDTLTLICFAESVPATYTWMLNGTKIHNSAVFTKNIIEYSDSGDYICEVMNNITGRTSSAGHALSVTDGSGGLSAGAIAGIVILCFVASSAGAAGGYYLYKKKTRRTCV